jgi:hypothetical protein
MTKPTLLNFGDSWAHGADVAPGERYADIMAAWWDYDLIDYSMASTSATRMILQLQEFLTTVYTPGQDYVALFFVTAQERQLLFTEAGQPREMHVQHDSEYYAQFYTSRLGTLTLNTTLIALQAMCRHYNIRDYYMLGWQYPVLWPTVDHSKFYAAGQLNAVNAIMGTDIKCNFHQIDVDQHPGFVNGHPSAAGHQSIARLWMRAVVQYDQAQSTT